MTTPTTPARKGKATPEVTTVQAAPALNAPALVQPPDGWEVQSDYGTLRTRASVDLVRLEDVHAWMASEGVPAHDAVYKIFWPFYQACLRLHDGGDIEPVIDELYVANALTHPDGLFKSNESSKARSPKIWASAFPDLGHVRFSAGPGVLIYAMGEGALRVWHGGANINTDHLAAWEDRKTRAEEGKYSIRWPKDEDLRLLLGRLAAPIQTAHALWGYGTVRAAEAVSSVAAGRAPSPQDVAYAALVATRTADKTAPWTDAMARTMAAEIDARKGRKGVRNGIAKELGYTSASGMNQALARVKARAAKPKRPPATAGLPTASFFEISAVKKVG